MQAIEDLYEILQVHPSARPEVIQASHWQLTQLYNPDHYSYPNARDLLNAIDRAYEVLSDPSRRAEYDQYRKAMNQIPDVVKAKSFQLVDDAGEVRAEFGIHTARHEDSLDTPPKLEFMDSGGQVRFEVSLDYFDRPHLVMRDLEDGNDQLSASLEIDSGEARLTMRDGDEDRIKMALQSGGSGPTLDMLDRDGILRLEAGLGGGDEGDSPRLALRDRAGRTRFEIELEEVELDRSVAQVGDDYELSPLRYAFPPRLKMRDASGRIRLELGLFGSDVADSPGLYVLDDSETPRVEIGYSDDSPRVVMKDKDGIDRLEVELAEVETDGGYDYFPKLRVLDEDGNIRFETELPGS